MYIRKSMGPKHFANIRMQRNHKGASFLPSEWVFRSDNTQNLYQILEPPENKQIDLGGSLFAS